MNRTLGSGMPVDLLKSRAFGARFPRQGPIQRTATCNCFYSKDHGLDKSR
jgi:hypothetical protein